MVKATIIKQATRAKFLLGFAFLAGTFLVSAVPASAGFTSLNKGSSQGKGEIIEMALNAGGAVITCEALEAGTSKAGWTIKSKGVAQTKGPNLQIKADNWGKCKAAKPIEESVKISGCELEVEQTGEQTKVSAKVIKTCVIEAPKVGCVIKAEPKSNEALTVMEVELAGETGESTVLVPAISNVVTTVNPACEIVGIKASKQGHLTGIGEFFLVQALGTREYKVEADKDSVMNMETFKFKVKRIGGANGMLGTGVIGLVQSPNAQVGQFMVTAADYTACTMTFNYILNGAACEMVVTYDKTKDLGYSRISVEGGANGRVISTRVVDGD